MQIKEASLRNVFNDNAMLMWYKLVQVASQSKMLKMWKAEHTALQLTFSEFEPEFLVGTNMKHLSVSVMRGDYHGSMKRKLLPWKSLSPGRGSTTVILTQVDSSPCNVFVRPYTTAHYSSQFVDSFDQIVPNDSNCMQTEAAVSVCACACVKMCVSCLVHF